MFTDLAASSPSSIAPMTIALACAAVILLGLSKGGLTGLGSLATPLLALAMPPAQAAAILLPLLIVGDAVGVWSFRKTWDRWILAWTLPGAFVGVVAGYMLAAYLPVGVLKGALGIITLSFGTHRLWVERGGKIVAASNSPGWVGALFGTAAGFTSQIAHAGGPPFQIWLAPRNLPHLTFLGTSGIFFAVVNLMKVPFYAALGEFTPANLMASAVLTPLAIVSAIAGVWLVRRFDSKQFYTVVYWLMVLLGAKLLWDAVLG
jgi:uncharacterized protein